MKIKSIACAVFLALMAVTNVSAEDKTIYLTFDDGPINATSALIDTLNDGGIRPHFTSMLGI